MLRLGLSQTEKQYNYSLMSIEKQTDKCNIEWKVSEYKTRLITNFDKDFDWGFRTEDSRVSKLIWGLITQTETNIKELHMLVTITIDRKGEYCNGKCENRIVLLIPIATFPRSVL